MTKKLFGNPLIIIPELRKTLRSLAVLNIRGPGACLSQNFPGFRILRNPSPTLALREGFLNSGMTTGGLAK